MYGLKISLGNVTKQHVERGNQPVTFRVISSGKSNLRVRMGAFGAKTRKSNFRNKITTAIFLSSGFCDLTSPTEPI